MKLERLKPGMRLANYKELCKVVGWDYKIGGNSKKCKLRKLDQYCHYERQGKAYLIGEIKKDTTLEQIKRTSRKNYFKDLEPLIIYYFRQHPKMTYVSPGKFLKLAGVYQEESLLLNDKESIHTMATRLKVSTTAIADLKNIVKHKNREIVHTALKCMEREGKLNLKKRILLKQGRGMKKATDEEAYLIRGIELEVIYQRRLKTYYQLYHDLKRKNFNHQVIENFVQRNRGPLRGTNISYYYKVYEVYLTTQGIINQVEFNEEICIETLRHNLKDYYLMRIDQLHKSGKHESAGVIHERGSERYVADMKKLLENLFGESCIDEERNEPLIGAIGFELIEKIY